MRHRARPVRPATVSATPACVVTPSAVAPDAIEISRIVSLPASATQTCPRIDSDRFGGVEARHAGRRAVDTAAGSDPPEPASAVTLREGSIFLIVLLPLSATLQVAFAVDRDPGRTAERGRAGRAVNIAGVAGRTRQRTDHARLADLPDRVVVGSTTMTVLS